MGLSLGQIVQDTELDFEDAEMRQVTGKGVYSQGQAGICLVV